MTSLKLIVVCFLVSIMGQFPASFAGTVSLTGREPQLWGDGGISVVIARVVSVGLAPNGSHYEATIEPLALLGGTIDPTRTPTLRVIFVAGEQASLTIHIVPRKGAMILAVLRDGNFVHGDACTFMPGRVPLVVIDGWGDKRIEETLKEIRDARAHPDPDPNAENAKDDVKKSAKLTEPR